LEDFGCLEVDDADSGLQLLVFFGGSGDSEVTEPDLWMGDVWRHTKIFVHVILQWTMLAA
jgi:hypothetical protein